MEQSEQRQKWAAAIDLEDIEAAWELAAALVNLDRKNAVDQLAVKVSEAVPEDDQHAKRALSLLIALFYTNNFGQGVAARIKMELADALLDKRAEQ